MALQRKHRDGGIKNSSTRKMTLDEFRQLLNEAYAFLGVKVDAETARLVFEASDTDRDGLITYEEYFKFIETAICRPAGTVVETKRRPELPKTVIKLTDTENAILVNFRRLLWSELLRIYNKYDANGNGDLERGEFLMLLRELLYDFNQSSLDAVLKNAFKVNMGGDTKFLFDEFVSEATKIGRLLHQAHFRDRTRLVQSQPSGQQSYHQRRRVLAHLPKVIRIFARP